MAGTNPKKNRSAPAKIGRQAAAQTWTPEQLLSAFDDRTDDQRAAALRQAGILDETGKIAQLYRNWGEKVTRTPEADESLGPTRTTKLGECAQLDTRGTPERPTEP